MTNIEFKEKILRTTGDREKREIVVTHVTIRQSIFFLHLRIVTLEIITALIILSFHTVIMTAQSRNLIEEGLVAFNIPVFLILVAVKLFLVIFVIVQWLNEYYEITPSEVRFRKGLIFKREEKSKMEHIGSVKLEQGIFGRIFNFGTIKLFNWTTEKDVLLYLIHNPLKYQKILEDLLPEADKEKRVVREHILEEEEI